MSLENWSEDGYVSKIKKLEIENEKMLVALEFVRVSLKIYVRDKASPSVEKMKSIIDAIDNALWQN